MCPGRRGRRGRSWSTVSPETCAPSGRFPVTSCRTTCCCRTSPCTRPWWYQTLQYYIYSFISCRYSLCSIYSCSAVFESICFRHLVWCLLSLQVSANLKLQEKVEARREMVSPDPRLLPGHIHARKTKRRREGYFPAYKKNMLLQFHINIHFEYFLLMLLYTFALHFLSVTL